MFDDLKIVKSSSDGFMGIKIGIKVIDELVACHGIKLLEGLGEFLASQMKHHVNNNLKNDENYYNKLQEKLTKKILERKKKETV